MPEFIHIEIVDIDQPILCLSECSTDWSQLETQAQARNNLWKRFGNHIRLDFVSNGNTDEQFSNENRYPLLIINGQIRLSGQFDIRQLIEIVETQMEIGAPVQ